MKKRGSQVGELEQLKLKVVVLHDDIDKDIHNFELPKSPFLPLPSQRDSRAQQVSLNILFVLLPQCHPWILDEILQHHGSGPWC